jgi:hypothetical protein
MSDEPAEEQPDDPAAGRAIGRMGRRGAHHVTSRVRALFETGGRGFRDLAIVQVASTAHDTLVAVALAGTLFFSVPSAEARGNVALYLLLTVAPFALIGPLLGRLLDRSSLAMRTVLVLAAIGRAVLAVSLIERHDSWLLFPVAFGLLVLSRVHAIARHSLLPVALDEPRALVAANGRLAWIGVLAGGLAAALGLGAIQLLGPSGALGLAALAALLNAQIGRRLPDPRGEAGATLAPSPVPRLHLPRKVRMAQIATGAVRLINGFLLLLLAFAFHEAQAGLLDFGAVLAAAGVGFAIASLAAPHLERRLREEPMVVAALAVEAAAAFSAGQWFELPTAAALAAAAGFAWGTAKLAFDGLLQAAVPHERRGAAFTRSETLFAVAWVLGAVVPTALPLPTGLGLALAGFAALGAQIVYVGALLDPAQEPQEAADERPPP